MGGTDDGEAWFDTALVTSRDGTLISYVRVGHGPSLVLVHGAGQTGQNLLALARHLSDAFTVYVPDRRGRGGSGACRDDHGLSTEMDDLGAVLDASAAQRVFGLSSGAVIAIETARVRPDITKLALYEPPLSFDGVSHTGWVPRYEHELEHGNLGGALVAVLKGTGDRTSVFRYLPESLLAAGLSFLIRRTAGRPARPGTVSPRDLIATIHYDTVVVRAAAGDLRRFESLGCQVLLLGGSRSAPELTATLDGLASVLPNADRITLKGVGHTAADNSGKPALVASELRWFFI